MYFYYGAFRVKCSFSHLAMWLRFRLGLGVFFFKFWGVVGWQQTLPGELWSGICLCVFLLLVCCVLQRRIFICVCSGERQRHMGCCMAIFLILEAESFGVAELWVVLSSEVCFRASPFLYVVYLREMVRQKEKICWSFLFVCRFGFYCVGCKVFSEGLCGSWCRSSCERWSGRSCWCCCQNGFSWLMHITDDAHCHYPSKHKAWGKWYHKFMYKHRSQQEAPYALLNKQKVPSIWGPGTTINKVSYKYTGKFLGVL